MAKGGYVYIMTTNKNTVLYTGVTSNLFTRITQHKDHFYPNSFTRKYNVIKLVYYECYASIEEAIAREKQIKAGSRQDKIDLINKMNAGWTDLFEIIKDDI
ncbi:MAG: GIY-YIG nuclease family protein [Bacteroidales bacterium]|nr:GIY-YIG nuclease family protein [Bacteroidales bacterium]